MSIFKRYMVVKDPTKAHAVLSASGSERWLKCPASVKLSEGMPREDNIYGIRGTNTHTLIQFILENYKQWRSLLDSKEALSFKKFIGFDEGMLQSALFHVNYVRQEYRRMWKDSGTKPDLYVEKKVELKGVGFGTSDDIIYQPFGVLHVIDFKNGTYVVNPEHNTQGLYYAVATADLVGWDFDEAWITISQPNASNKRGPIRTWKTTPKVLKEARSMFLEGAERTRAKNPKVVPDSKYCWFCPGRTKCPAQMEKKREKALTYFE